MITNISKKKNKKKPFPIFFVLLGVIIISYVFRYFYYDIDTHVAKYVKLENVIITEGVFVRTEFVTDLPEKVLDEYKKNEGQRLSIDSKILEIPQNANTDSGIWPKISKLNERIKEIENSEQDNSFFSKDKEKINTSIYTNIRELKEIINSGDFSEISNIKNELSASLYKKSLIYGIGSFSGKNIQQLQAEKESLESIYKNSIKLVKAQSSGVVSYNIDGYEQILNPLNIDNFNINGIKDIMATLGEKLEEDAESNFGVKVVDNFEWFLCCVVSSEQGESFKKGKKIDIRLSEHDNEEISGHIFKISEAQNNEKLLIIKGNTQFKDYYKIRLAKIEIIKDYDEGYIVPQNIIVELDGTKGVYVDKRGIVKFAPVDIVADFEKDVMIQNTNHDNVDESNDWKKLIQYDHIIKSINRVKENQILPGTI